MHCTETAKQSLRLWTTHWPRPDCAMRSARTRACVASNCKRARANGQKRTIKNQITCARCVAAELTKLSKFRRVLVHVLALPTITNLCSSPSPKKHRYRVGSGRKSPHARTRSVCVCAYFRNLSACTLARTHTHAEGSWHDITSLIRRVCATANGRRGAVNQNNSFARVHARPASANSKELFSGLWCVCARARFAHARSRSTQCATASNMRAQVHMQTSTVSTCCSVRSQSALYFTCAHETG